jgi:hypothetical protein
MEVLLDKRTKDAAQRPGAMERLRVGEIVRFSLHRILPFRRYQVLLRSAA